MRPLNNFANRAFAILFSYLLNQRFTDTLCGTKALWRRDYEKIVRSRGYFGDFDPFGDRKQRRLLGIRQNRHDHVVE